MASPAAAAGPDGGFTVKGVGNDSCGAWTGGRGQAVQYLQNQWLLGYVTADGRDTWARSNDIANGVDNDGLIAWVTTYCASNPLDTIALAARGLVLELNSRYSASHQPKPKTP